MAANVLKEYLDKQCVAHRSIVHTQAFTAQRTAEATHVRGMNMAKTVVLNVDGRMCMAVVPAHFHVDLEKLKGAAGASTVKLVDELELKKLFPDCETGAMPPFGNLYGMNVYVQQQLTSDKEIAFNACSHTEVIEVAFRDFERLVQPMIADFAH
jgi:Ala-tRNA(Pro) deacylase